MAVPEVIDHGDDGVVEWLLTAGLFGVGATTKQHVADPAATVPLLADGLRSFHEIDLRDCPFDYRMPVRTTRTCSLTATASSGTSIAAICTACCTTSSPDRPSTGGDLD